MTTALPPQWTEIEFHAGEGFKVATAEGFTFRKVSTMVDGDEVHAKWVATRDADGEIVATDTSPTGMADNLTFMVWAGLV